MNYLNSLGVGTDVFSLRSVRSRPPVLGRAKRLTSSCVYPRPLTRLSKVREWNASKKQRMLDRFFSSEAICQIYANAPVSPSRTLRSCTRIYDCVDDFASFPWVSTPQRSAMAHDERSLGEWADRIWVVSRKLEERLSPLFGNKIEFIPNGVDYDHFRSVPQLRATAPKGRPRLGYVGTIWSWLDTELIRGVADALRDWLIVLVGPNFLTSDESKLLDAPNIHHAGRISYDKLPEVMATFDVGMIPFRLTKVIEATSPIKLYEYLAAGLPVVATPMPEVVPFAESGVVMCSETVGGFAEAVRDLASNGRPVRCQEIARDHSWRARFEKPLAEIVGAKQGAQPLSGLSLAGHP